MWMIKMTVKRKKKNFKRENKNRKRKKRFKKITTETVGIDG